MCVGGGVKPPAVSWLLTAERLPNLQAGLRTAGTAALGMSAVMTALTVVMNATR